MVRHFQTFLFSFSKSHHLQMRWEWSLQIFIFFSKLRLDHRWGYWAQIFSSSLIWSMWIHNYLFSLLNSDNCSDSPSSKSKLSKLDFFLLSQLVGWFKIHSFRFLFFSFGTFSLFHFEFLWWVLFFFSWRCLNLGWLADFCTLYGLFLFLFFLFFRFRSNWLLYFFGSFRHCRLFIDVLGFLFWRHNILEFKYKIDIFDKFTNTWSAQSLFHLFY